MKGGLGGLTGGGWQSTLAGLAAAFEGLDSLSPSLARNMAAMAFQLGDQQAIIEWLGETLTDEEREQLLTQCVSASPQGTLEELLQLPGGEAALVAITALLEPTAPPEPPAEPPPPDPSVKRKVGWQWAARKGKSRPLEECVGLLQGRPKDVSLDLWAGCRRLVGLRLELEMNQRQFAEQVVGMQQAHYGALERGKHHPLHNYPGWTDNPWSNRARAVCEALGVQPEDIWQEIAPPHPYISWPTVGAWTERASRSMEYLEELDELESLWPALQDHPRHEEAIRRYHGINDLGPVILEEVGEHLEVTRERVRQIIKRGLEMMAAWGPPKPKPEPGEPTPSMRELAANFTRLLKKPSVQRTVWTQVRGPRSGCTAVVDAETPRAAKGSWAEGWHRAPKEPKRKRVKRQKLPIYRQDVGYAADRRAAKVDPPITVTPGLTMQQALHKLDRIWNLCRGRILEGMSGVMRSREEDELLRLAELRVGAAAPNPMTFPGMADALIIFPYGNTYKPFPMGEDAWVDVKFLREEAASLGFSSKAVPPFHIAFFWKGEGSCHTRTSLKRPSPG